MHARLALARDLLLPAIAAVLAPLAVTACVQGASLGTARTPLLITGCAGLLGALALFLTRAGASSRTRNASATAGFLLAVAAGLVLMLVCGMAAGPSRD